MADTGAFYRDENARLACSDKRSKKECTYFNFLFIFGLVSLSQRSRLQIGFGSSILCVMDVFATAVNDVVCTIYGDSKFRIVCCSLTHPLAPDVL